MRSSRAVEPNWLRILIVSAALIDAVIWLPYVRDAVADSDRLTRPLQRDIALVIVAAYAATAGVALVLAWRCRRLRLALVLAALPMLAMAALWAAFTPWE